MKQFTVIFSVNAKIAVLLWYNIENISGESLYIMKIIAHIRTDFPTKFGIPRQSGLTDFESVIVFEPEYRRDEALRGIEGYSHLWIIWEFSEAKRDTWSPTVRPPRLGGNTRMGVFATRSPFRPNPVGLSSVKLLGTEKTDEGTVLKISGADLMDGTPIYDTKLVPEGGVSASSAGENPRGEKRIPAGASVGGSAAPVPG